MPVLLSIITTDDIIDDAGRSEGQERDPDVKSALKTDARAFAARKAARRGHQMVKDLSVRSEQNEHS